MKILIVEDEVVTQDLIKTILRDYPSEIETAGTFAESLLKKTSFEPDIILLDCKLPDSDEKTLKRNIALLKSNCAVILLTGYLKQESFIEAHEAGVEASFSKDILTQADHFLSELTRIWYSYKIQGKSPNQSKNLTQSLALKKATITESEILFVLNNQNINQEKTNYKIFEKLDEAAALAREAKEKAAHAAETGEEIKQQFLKLNGKVSATILRVGSLENIELDRTKQEQKIKWIAEGKWFLPKKTKEILILLGKVAAALLSIFGFFALIWPFVKIYLLHLP